MTDVHAYADQLRQYATHFEHRDWCYSRDLGDLQAFRYDRPEDRLPGRIKQSLYWLFRRTRDWERQVGFVGWRHRLGMTRFALRRDSHLPDGWIEAMGVFTTWEETGEYLQYVQPTVGELLADLMDAHPDLPEVQAIADEMKRINDDYGRRIAEEAA